MYLIRTKTISRAVYTYKNVKIFNWLNIILDDIHALKERQVGYEKHIQQKTEEIQGNKDKFNTCNTRGLIRFTIDMGKLFLSCFVL